jgi:hypothetical protein
MESQYFLAALFQFRPFVDCIQIKADQCADRIFDFTGRIGNENFRMDSPHILEQIPLGRLATGTERRQFLDLAHDDDTEFIEMCLELSHTIPEIVDSGVVQVRESDRWRWTPRNIAI